MKVLCNLIRQYPKPSIPILGNVTIVNEVDNAMFFDKQERCVAVLVRPRLKFITAIGMFFTGFEDKGSDKYGNVKFIYQEWWCPFIGVVEEKKRTEVKFTSEQQDIMNKLIGEE